jgi:pilus assembly protein Flp/PilA
MIRKFFNEERGVTMIEYGLIAALIGVACVVTLTVLGDTIENVLWQAVSTGLNTASP